MATRVASGVPCPGVFQEAEPSHRREQKIYLRYNLLKDKVESEHYMDITTPARALRAIAQLARAPFRHGVIPHASVTLPLVIGLFVNRYEFGFAV